MGRSLAVLVALPALGCASILSSGPTTLDFRSDPEGAEVLVNGESWGRTPVKLELHADEEYVITFRREGCKDHTTQLQTHVQAGWVILDIVTGVVGVAVDAGTGEWREFNDRTPFVRLDC